MNNETTATGAVVVGPHPLAAAAAREVMAAGGNAVDAAIAAMLALCVATPHQVGLGGYGGAMVIYRPEERKAFAIDFDSRAPLEFEGARFAADPALAKHGALGVSVPGVVAGLDLALRRFGSMPWRRVS